MHDVLYLNFTRFNEKLLHVIQVLPVSLRSCKSPAHLSKFHILLHYSISWFQILACRYNPPVTLCWRKNLVAGQRNCYWNAMWFRYVPFCKNRKTFIYNNCNLNNLGFQFWNFLKFFRNTQTVFFFFSIGLTAIKAVDVHNLLRNDYPEKYQVIWQQVKIYKQKTAFWVTTSPNFAVIYASLFCGAHWYHVMWKTVEKFIVVTLVDL